MKKGMGGVGTKGVEGWKGYPHNRKEAKYGRKEVGVRAERRSINPCCDTSN